MIRLLYILALAGLIFSSTANYARASDLIFQPTDCSADGSESDLPKGVKQPNYEHWQAISVGMSTNEVCSLIGEPHKIISASVYSVWGYGDIFPQATEFPAVYNFSILFVGGKVSHKQDPFLGSFSTNGLPSSPILISPQDGAVFSHHPRILDFRWQPSSGVYPLSYEVDLLPPIRKTDRPWFSSSSLHAGQHRWRVRGVNALGAGPWSPRWTFTFENKKGRTGDELEETNRGHPLEARANWGRPSQ